MFRGHVPPVQASKARAILNLAGQKKWACFASMSARKTGLVFLFGAGGTQLAPRCDAGRVHHLLHPRLLATHHSAEQSL
jgi:hypothetical protein